MESTLKQIALEKLLSPPCEESLLNWINWLDLESAMASPESVQVQILTRSVVATGYELVKKQNFPATHPVVKTIKAAEVYILEPSQDLFDNYFMAASDSYPFGSGEGCYAVDELGYPGCEPGSGCMSGAGSLYNMAGVLGPAIVMQSIARELIPWLSSY
jgi:hypothetical protein